jgi:hypothetical protein
LYLCIKKAGRQNRLIVEALALPAAQGVKLAAVVVLADLLGVAQRPKSGWIHRHDHLERQRG